MRRAAPVLIATAAGLALLASFHTDSSPTSTVAAVAAETTTSTTAAKRSSTTATPRTTVPAPRSVDGSAIATKFGPVQVRVTVQGTRIVDVQNVQMPASHQRSAEITQQATPVLRSEVLQAQSARINILSGASYTSQAYAQSVQSALDRAGV